MSHALELEQQYLAHNYAPLPVVLSRGRGVWVWDQDGRRYLDMMSAYSAVSHGHCHPRLVAALERQAGRLGVVSRAFCSDRLGTFVERLCTLTGMEQALPMNTGAEAVETALKAARKWGYQVKGIPAGQAEIVVCDGNFHGRTTTLVGFSSEPAYRRGFGPFTPGFVSIPFGDSDALERAITPHTAAFLVEPIQGEGGIVVPPPGYLARCAQLCREHQVLLLADEIQTGLGRTGALLACDHEGVKPDGLMLGKALGGGLLPVSAFLSSRAVMELFTPGDHGSTFGGYPLAAAVGLEALQVLQDEQLVERAATLGAQLMDGLAALDSGLIRRIRGKGMLTGVVIDAERISGRALCTALARHGVLSKETHDTVVRFAPPLVISEQELGEGLRRIAETFRELEQGAIL